MLKNKIETMKPVSARTSNGSKLMDKEQHNRENRYVCEICGVYKPKTISSLREHQRTVHNVGTESVNDCLFCKKKLSGRARLEKHLRSHTKEHPYFCKVCSKECSKQYHLNQHTRTHEINQKEKLACTACPRVFCGTQRLNDHIRRVHAEANTIKPYTCDICFKKFGSMQYLGIHKLTHTKEKPHVCQICEKGFTQRQHLQGHMLTHTKEKPYSCKICQKRFNHGAGLACHLKTEHFREKLLKCDTCGKSFLTKTYLKYHQRSHTGEKPFLCTTCGKRFTVLRNLTNHLRIHDANEDLECQICKKKFQKETSVKRHILFAHDQTKPFPCKICFQRFVGKDSLNVHMKKFHSVGFIKVDSS